MLENIGSFSEASPFLGKRVFKASEITEMDLKRAEIFHASKRF